MIPDFLVSSYIELIWFAGIILFSCVIFFGKNKTRGFFLNLGAVMLIICYSFMLQESLLSFTELGILQWGIRLGITFILFDLAKRTEVPNPIESFKKIKNKITTRGKRKYD